jgi:hypothetical protein
MSDEERQGDCEVEIARGQCDIQADQVFGKRCR